MESVKPYKKSFSYSYTLGAFPTFELLKARQEEEQPDFSIQAVYAHDSFTGREHLERLCTAQNIPILPGEKALNRVSGKENVFVLGVFSKYEQTLRSDRSHVVLVHPGDMGNLGTILRTAAAFDLRDIALIGPAADIFHPKTVRASMGALFRLRHQYFESWEAYRAQYPQQEIFPFMLDGKITLTPETCPHPPLFSLIFGNEAAGLDASFHQKGTSVALPQTSAVDSLNLTIAAGIGMFLFTQTGRPDKTVSL